MLCESLVLLERILIIEFFNADSAKERMHEIIMLPINIYINKELVTVDTKTVLRRTLMVLQQILLIEASVANITCEEMNYSTVSC